MFAPDWSLGHRSTAQRLQARQGRSDPRRRTSAPDTHEHPLPSSTARSSLRQSPKPKSCHVTALSVSWSTCTDAASLAARERSQCAFPSTAPATIPQRRGTYDQYRRGNRSAEQHRIESNSKLQRISVSSHHYGMAGQKRWSVYEEGGRSPGTSNTDAATRGVVRALNNVSKLIRREAGTRGGGPRTRATSA